MKSHEGDNDTTHSFTYKSKPLLDLSQADTETGARNSIFMDPAVIGKMLEFLNSSKDSGLTPLSIQIIESSISRGFMNMFETLKLEYVDLLN